LILSPSGGLESSTLHQLFAWPSRFWAIGESLSETLFNGGLRRATVDQFTGTPLRASLTQDYHQLDIWNRAMDCCGRVQIGCGFAG